MKPLSSSLLSMLCGSLGFGVVSIVAFSIWAFRLAPGAGPMFALIALTYIGLSGPILSRLFATKGATFRFSVIFAFAFLAYAIIWCIFWFGLEGKHKADLFGSAVGIAALTWILQRLVGRGKPQGFLSNCGVVFLLHTLGYYLGGEGYSLAGGPLGRLLWGAGYGIGFGAGLGYLLYQCQNARPAT